MIRRWLALLLSTGMLLALAPPAQGWSNGPDGYNSFGAHDWILAKALKAPDSPNWINRRVALRATDDPDSKDGLDYASGTWWHVWDEWGATYGGAPEAAEHWYRVAKRRKANGNFRRASKAVGILAHIVGDVGNPTHTDSINREDRMHSSHESATDSRLATFHFRWDGFTRREPYSATRGLARRSHRYYDRLVNHYVNNGYDSTVQKITQRSLNRAANRLADLLRGLK